MKTVNFLEALEANKTRRIAFWYDKVNVIDSWYEVGEMERDLKNESKTLLYSELVGPWVVEPEKVEFECMWEKTAFDVVYPSNPGGDEGVLHLLKSVIGNGKRTKVTIEVLS